MDAYKIKLGAAGAINALAFAFLPPLYSMLTRFSQDSADVQNGDQVVTALDIPDRPISAAGGNIFLWAAVIIISAIVFYINFNAIRSIFAAVIRSMKFIHAAFPFCGWLLVAALLMGTGMWRSYVVFATNDDGSLFGGSFIALGYMALIFLNGLIVLFASITAFYVSRNMAIRQKNTSGGDNP